MFSKPIKEIRESLPSLINFKKKRSMPFGMKCELASMEWRKAFDPLFLKN